MSQVAVAKTVDPSQRIPTFEKVGYSLADAAANFVFMSMILFQAAFYTDVMKIDAGTAGLIILVPRLWDAFFDPIMGITADRTHTRWGRFRPWVLWTAIPWGIVMWLAYTVPGFHGGALIAYAVVTNTMLMTLYSANNMPYSALGGVMSSDLGERAKLNSFRFIAVNAAQFIVQGFTLVWVSKFANGNTAHGWSVVFGGYAVLCMVCFVITFATTKERVKPLYEEKADAKVPASTVGSAKALDYASAPRAAKSTVKQDFSDLFKNGPWATMFVMMLFHFCILAFRGGAEYQYYQHYADRQAMFHFLQPLGLTAGPVAAGQTAPGGIIETLGYMVHADASNPASIQSSNVANAVYGLIGMIGKALTIIVIIFSAPMAKRFGKKAICVAGFGLMILNSIAFYFIPRDAIWMMLILSVTGAIIYAPTIPLVWAMFADVADYGEWKTGRRATGIIFATIGFALKAGLAIGAYGLLEIQSIMHYDPDNVSNSITEMFRVCTTIVPGILFLICTIMFIMYKLDKHTTEKVVNELAARKAAAAVA